jgi:hypothetical protein
MIVAIGTEGTIVEQDLSVKILNCLWSIVDIHERLWDAEGVSDMELQDLDIKIKDMLRQFKLLWKDMSKSGCRFPKFHYTLHLTYIAKQYGSLRVIDTCVGETKNKDVKTIYRRTTKKKSGIESQMFEAASLKQRLSNEARDLGTIV